MVEYNTRPNPRRSVPSPCVSICTISSEGGYCAGCYRTLKEIARWARMDDAERDGIIADLPVRAQAAAGAR